MRQKKAKTNNKLVKLTPFLLEQQRRLKNEARKHFSKLDIVQEGTSLRDEDKPDEADLASSLSTQHVNIELANRENAKLRQVTKALWRIMTGTYGKCLECDKEIAKKRLEAVPEASLCKACQELKDGNINHGAMLAGFDQLSA